MKYLVYKVFNLVCPNVHTQYDNCDVVLLLVPTIAVKKEYKLIVGMRSEAKLQHIKNILSIGI